MAPRRRAQFEVTGTGYGDSNFIKYNNNKIHENVKKISEEQNNKILLSDSFKIHYGTNSKKIDITELS